MVSSVLLTSGCVSMFQIGEDPTDCGTEYEQGMPCTSAKDIWKMTDSRTSLKGVTVDENGNVHDANTTSTEDVASNMVLMPYPDPEERRVSVVYRHDENLPAPEPIAVRQEPKILRVLMNAWEDDNKNLHMPGYSYIEIEPRRWVVGRGAIDKPSRITPLSIRKKSQEEERAGNMKKDNSMGIIQRQAIQTAIPQ